MPRLLPMISAALLFSACNFDGRAHDDIVSQTWTLVQLNGRPVPVGDVEAATVRFMTDRRIEGTSSCNRVSSPEVWWNILGYEFRWDWLAAEYRWSANQAGTAGRFDAARLVITAVGCGEGPVVQSGAAFWTAMQHARRWTIRDRNLIIAFANGSNAILVPQSSQASR